MASSARVVRCWVKSAGATLTFSCHHLVGHLKELPVISWRKVGMTSSPHGPYVLGYTRATMAFTIEARWRHRANPKDPQFGCTLQLECMTGITSNRGSARRGELVPGSYYTRPSHHGSWFYLKAKFKTFDHGIVSDWGVEQGSRRGTCGWITSFLRIIKNNLI